MVGRGSVKPKAWIVLPIHPRMLIKGLKVSIWDMIDDMCHVVPKADEMGFDVP